MAGPDLMGMMGGPMRGPMGLMGGMLENSGGPGLDFGFGGFAGLLLMRCLWHASAVMCCMSELLQARNLPPVLVSQELPGLKPCKAWNSAAGDASIASRVLEMR